MILIKNESTSRQSWDLSGVQGVQITYLPQNMSAGSFGFFVDHNRPRSTIIEHCRPLLDQMKYLLAGDAEARLRVSVWRTFFKGHFETCIWNKTEISVNNLNIIIVIQHVEVAFREIDNLLADRTMLRLLWEKCLVEAKCVSLTSGWIQTLPMVGMATVQEEHLLISLVLLTT